VLYLAAEKICPTKTKNKEQRTILTGAEDNTYRSRGQYLQEQRTILTGAEDNTYRSRGQYLQE
jgi:hypothetical protein